MAYQKNDESIALALSGGGFRATLFNLGGLWRLNEAGLLRCLDIITSVSGGSITSGVLALAWKNLRFEDGVATNFQEMVVAPLRAFCLRYVDIPSILSGFVSPIRTIADKVAARYRKHLYGQATLQDLPDSSRNRDDPEYAPTFLFYATSLQTGSSVRMCREELSDYKLGKVRKPNLPLATVVAASSAFPPFFSPLKLKLDPENWKKTVKAYLYENRALRKTLVLTDGGVYDNMGLEAVYKKYDIVLVSDAGAKLEIHDKAPRKWVQQLRWVFNIVTEQTRALRRRDLVGNFATGKRKGTYWGIGTKIADYKLPEVLAVDNAVTASQLEISTRLRRFSEAKQCRLINWGYALADAAMRKYVLPDENMGALPYPEYPLA